MIRVFKLYIYIFYPVSYTHLDVYKRQAGDNITFLQPRKLGFADLGRVDSSVRHINQIRDCTLIEDLALI